MHGHAGCTLARRGPPKPMQRLRSTPRTVAVLLGVALGLVAWSTVTATETTSTCASTPNVLPIQDVKFGACLFRSTTAFGQLNPNHIFASCNGCHPNGSTDRGVHAVMVTNNHGQTVVVSRKTPNLRNVAFNFPFGWDGRHGGAADLAALRAGIQAAITRAITSPIEMNGKPPTPVQLKALTAFLLSRSPTKPPANEPPPPPP